MWEIVWSNGQLYDVCDEHARLHETVHYEAAADGSLRSLDVEEASSGTQVRHRTRRAQSSV
jgi:hypothetical protein